jgi:hypothetical protein
MSSDVFNSTAESLEMKKKLVSIGLPDKVVLCYGVCHTPNKIHYGNSIRSFST